MTREELIRWLEEHPSDLVRVAWTLRAVRARAVQAEDAVQEGLLRILTTKNYERCRTKPLAWFMQSVKSAVHNRLTAAKRTGTAKANLRQLLTPGTFRHSAAVNEDEHGYQGVSDWTTALPVDTNPDGLYPSPEELLITPEDREAERMEWQTQREQAAKRREAQDPRRQWDQRGRHVTWYYADGRVAATNDPTQTAGNLRAPVMSAAVV